jgi:hypothetical protein
VAGTCEHGNDNPSTEAVRFVIKVLIQGGAQSVCHMWFLCTLAKDLVRVLTKVGSPSTLGTATVILRRAMPNFHFLGTQEPNFNNRNQ